MSPKKSPAGKSVSQLEFSLIAFATSVSLHAAKLHYGELHAAKLYYSELHAAKLYYSELHEPTAVTPELQRHSALAAQRGARVDELDHGRQMQAARRRWFYKQAKRLANATGVLQLVLPQGACLVDDQLVCGTLVHAALALQQAAHLAQKGIHGSPGTRVGAIGQQT